MHLAAHHNAVKIGTVDALRIHRGNALPVLHHVNAVADFQHFIETMGNKDKARTGFKRPDTLKEDIDFRLLQNRCRLIEQNDQIAIDTIGKRQCLGKFYHLTFCKGEIPGKTCRIGTNTDLFQMPDSGLVHLAPVHKSKADETLFLTKKYILGNRKVQQQRLLLKHHSNALLVRLLGRVDGEGLAIAGNRSRTWTLSSCENAHQG